MYKKKLQARQFGSAKFVSSRKHCKMHVHAVRIQNEIPARRDRQKKINVISSYSSLPVMRCENLKKKLTILSGTTLNESNFFAEG